MRLLFIACVLLVAELHSKSIYLEENSLENWLETRLEQEALFSGGKRSLTSFYWTPYEDPQPVLNDSVFATVEEYPDGYTGYLCSTEGDIRYTLEPCSQHVWECSDGKLLKKTCSESSIFWFSEGTCDSTVFQEESTCKQKRKHIRGSYWPPKFIHIAKVREFNSLAPGSSPTLITTDCRKYSSAIFEIEKCHPEYVRCYEGVRLMETCPMNRVFDGRQLYCVLKENCGAPILPIDFHRMEPILLDIPENAEFSDPILITIDCVKKADNHYEIGKCQPYWIECRDGDRTMHSCRGGKVYNYYRGCIELKECEEAWRKDATTTAPAPIVEEEEEFVPTWPDQMVLVPTVEDCVGKSNWRHAMSPCQTEYIYCHRGSGYKLKCSDGFVLSRRYRYCVGKEFCDF